MPTVINFVLLALQGIILVDVVLSWVKPDPREFPRSLTTQITEPLYAPIRALINPQKLGGIDISPMIIIILLNGMRSMLRGAL